MGRLIKAISSLVATVAISISTALNADAQPVESFQIAKSGNLTPSLYTGALTYSLPIYTYSDPNFNIPISKERAELCGSSNYYLFVYSPKNKYIIQG